MKVEVFNLSYFLVLIILTLIFVLNLILLKRTDKKKAFNYLLIWCFVGFALHFIKQLIYNDFEALRKSTLENICAVSTVFFPFIMMIKKDSILKDFMYFIGVLGGAAGLLYPTEAIGKELFAFEPIRFYFCHFSLLAIPLLLALLNIYKPRLKYFYLIPLLFLGVEAIIFINTFVVTYTGLVTKEGYTWFELFMDKEYLNNSFVFGPTEDTGDVGRIIGALCPNFLKIDYFNLKDGGTWYFPVLWLLFPSYIIFTPIYVILVLPFNLKRKALKSL